MHGKAFYRTAAEAIFALGILPVSISSTVSDRRFSCKVGVNFFEVSYKAKFSIYFCKIKVKSNKIVVHFSKTKY